jgi:hypothetical protein
MSPSNKRQSKKAKPTTASINMPPPIDSNSTSPATIPEIPFDFDFFIRNADIIAVHDFLTAVSPTPEGRNLKLLWKRAYEEGRNQGIDEGLSKCSDDYARGLKAGSEMATTYFDAGREQGMEEGEEHGQEVEHQVWLSSGHGVGQCTPTGELRSFMSTALQTDNPVTTPTTTVSTQTSIVSHLDSSAQAPEPPPSPNQPQKTSTAPLDWAEDANTLPIIPLSPSPCQPRDLSVLRSSSSSPFSSLQHRSKRFTHYSRQPRRHHSQSNFNPFYSPRRNSFKPSQPHFNTKTYSHLNWESDPRLSDLSRSLKALGWIRAS